MFGTCISYGYNLLIALIILAIGYGCAALVRRLAFRACAKARAEATIASFISQVLFWSVLAAFIIAALNQSGIYTTSFVAVFGALFAALIITLQKTLGNAIGGAMLLIQRPFRVGDRIRIGDIEGDVADMTVSYTFITQGEDTAMIPNSKLLDSTVIKKKSSQ